MSASSTFILFLFYEIITPFYSSTFFSGTHLMYSEVIDEYSGEPISDSYEWCNWNSYSDDSGIEFLSSRERAVLVYGAHWYRGKSVATKRRWIDRCRYFHDTAVCKWEHDYCERCTGWIQCSYREKRLCGTKWWNCPIYRYGKLWNICTERMCYEEIVTLTHSIREISLPFFVWKNAEIRDI